MPKNTTKSNTKKKKKKMTQLTLSGKKQSKVPKKAAAGTTKKRKKRQEFSIAEKLQILDELNKGLSQQKQIIAKYNTNRVSVSTWKKQRAQLEKQLDEELRGGRKKMFINDPLKRIKHGVRMFYDLNETMPKALKIPITRKYTWYSVCIACCTHHLSHALINSI